MAGVWVFNFLTAEEIVCQNLKSKLVCEIQPQRGSGHHFWHLLMQNQTWVKNYKYRILGSGGKVEGEVGGPHFHPHQGAFRILQKKS